MADNTQKKGRYRVLVGAAGVIDHTGRAVYHRLGDLVDLAAHDAERLLGVRAVEDTQTQPATPATGQPAGKATPAPATPPPPGA